MLTCHLLHVHSNRMSIVHSCVCVSTRTTRVNEVTKSMSSVADVDVYPCRTVVVDVYPCRTVVVVVDVYPCRMVVVVVDVYPCRSVVVGSL